MAGYSAPPPTVNVAAGATKGRFLVGTGPDVAAWSALTVAGPVGAESDAVSSLFSGLESMGADTSKLTDWDKPLTPNPLTSLPVGTAVARPNSAGSPGPGAGWWVLDSSVGAFGTWYRSPGLRGGDILAPGVIDAVYNPHAGAGANTARTLYFHTGQPSPYSGNVYYNALARRNNADVEWSQSSLPDMGPGVGSRFAFSTHSGMLGYFTSGSDIYKGLSLHTGGTNGPRFFSSYQA